MTHFQNVLAVSAAHDTEGVGRVWVESHTHTHTQLLWILPSAFSTTVASNSYTWSVL